jgi:transcriptional regulator with XRE-family HTH domain
VNQLLQFLRDNDLTHQQFADMCDVDRSTVTKWINGKRSPCAKAVAIINKKTKGQAAKIEDSPDLPYHKRLEFALLRKGLTFRAAAQRLYMSRNAVARYVKGDAVPKSRAKERIQKLLGV